ncbi:GcrA family cell cycle regulator [Bradyrhizobium sp.]|jgi:GcrA cell cycle regulator|uniref:GcrA family cell cycle regulator n=1 Tax=Bradyrhizobium sp. TaxID=376 RepID=UPI003D0BBC83
MQINWEPEHSEALRDYLAKGLSFAEIARAINARFHTAYSRNATIGRARRMGLAGLARSGNPGQPKRPRKPRPTRSHRTRKRRAAKPLMSRPILKRAAALKLRCVAIVPRHLSLLELQPDDCRYPFGGDEDGEAITFCGHPRRQGSSYCVSHFHLTRGRAPEPGAVKVLLRLVEAA